MGGGLVATPLGTNYVSVILIILKECKWVINWFKVNGNVFGMFLTIGITLIIATGVISFSKDRIVFLFSTESSQRFPENYLQLLLMIATLFLVYQWIRIHIGEIQMLNDNFEDFLPSLPRPSFPLIVSFSIILGILCYLSYDIIIYTSVFVLFSILDI